MSAAGPSQGAERRRPRARQRGGRMCGRMRRARALGGRIQCVRARRPPFVAGRHRPRAGARRRRPRASPRARDRLGRRGSVRPAGRARSGRAPRDSGRAAALAPPAAGPATWREIAAFRRDVRRDPYVAVLDLQEQVKGAVMARLARGPRHGPDRASIREPIATLGHDVHHRDRSRAAPDRPLPAARRGGTRLPRRRPAALRSCRAAAGTRRTDARRPLSRLRARDEPPRQAVARRELARADRRLCAAPASRSCCRGAAPTSARAASASPRGESAALVPPRQTLPGARRRCSPAPSSSSASTPDSCISPPRSARRPSRCSSPPIPARRRRAREPARARSRRHRQRVRRRTRSQDAAGALLQRAPRC